MKDKVLDRIKELTEQLERVLNERQTYISELQGMDIRIKELSASILELKRLLDPDIK